MINQATFSQDNRIISITELSQLLGKSKVSLWRYQRDKILPEPVKIQGRTLGWKASVIRAWLEQRGVQ